jgi:hypothetical protein
METYRIVVAIAAYLAAGAAIVIAYSRTIGPPPPGMGNTKVGAIGLLMVFLWPVVAGELLFNAFGWLLKGRR